MIHKMQYFLHFQVLDALELTIILKLRFQCLDTSTIIYLEDIQLWILKNIISNFTLRKTHEILLHNIGVRFALYQLSNVNVLYRTFSSDRVASLLDLPKHSDCISFFSFFLLRASNSFMLRQKQTRCILASKFCQLVIFYKVHRLYLEDELENRQRNAYTKIREMMTTLKKRDA